MNRPKKLSFEAESCFSTSNYSSNTPPARRSISPTMLLKKAESSLLNSPTISNFNENYEYFEPTDDDDRFFDSSDYRCCFSMLHAKIGTFIFCTWIFHEIVLGGIFLTTQIGLISTPLLLFLTFCRAAQFLTIILVYYALWKQKAILLFPFAIVQITIGMFADLYTVLTCMDYFDISNCFLLVYDTPHGKLLNKIVFFLLYIIAMLGLMWLLYKCYVFLRARNAHDEMRRMEKEREKQTLLKRFKVIIPPDSMAQQQQQQQQNWITTTLLTTTKQPLGFQPAPAILERTLDVETISISEQPAHDPPLIPNLT